MEMGSSTIIDLWFFLRRLDLHLGIRDGVGRSNFSRYGPLDLLLHQIYLGSFLIVATGNIVLVFLSRLLRP
jgi:hypothetical protein